MAAQQKSNTYVPGSGSNPELLVAGTGSNPELLVSLAGGGSGGSDSDAAAFGSSPELSRPRPVPTGAINRPTHLHGPIPQVQGLLSIARAQFNLVLKHHLIHADKTPKNVLNLTKLKNMQNFRIRVSWRNQLAHLSGDDCAFNKSSVQLCIRKRTNKQICLVY